MPSLTDATGSRETTGRAPRVALVNMPFSSSRFPSIPLGLLQAILERAGIPARTHYLSLRFAARVGWEQYDTLADVRGDYVGEWIFARAAFGENAPDAAGYLARYGAQLEAALAATGLTVEALEELRERVAPAFIEECLDAAPWGDYDVVGFGSMFQQICAGLAFARRLKERFPHLVIVFGGSNFEGEMGLELARAIPWIDYAVIGEGDEVFPALLRRLAAGDAVTAMPGVARRDGHGDVDYGGPAPLVRDLDALPDPDYTDYFADARAVGMPAVVRGYRVQMLYESARGCWWGAKHHCTFCGLANLERGYRSKSPRRVIDGIHAMARRFDNYTFGAVDNIMDQRYIRDVFASFAEERVDYEFFSEVKANLGPEHLRTLARGGVRCIQPGIESLSTPMLRLVDKGTTAIQNVRLLKWAKYHGIDVNWNILLGIPGETAADYERQLAVMRLIPHLQPPGGCGPIRMERFSPYFNDPGRWGIRILGSDPAYGFIYPPSIDRERIAYDFEHEAADTLPVEAHAPLIAAVESWRQVYRSERPPFLLFGLGAGRLRILDGRRPGPHEEHVFDERAALIYAFCSPVHHRAAQVTAHLRDDHGLDVSPSGVARALDGFVERGLMLEEDGYYLSLALPVNPNW